ncbi:PDDEXK-like family protein [Pontibacter sp. H249]|uniref:PDDEXK-like family protein n=1 Tax=Pontibacter sp. H249 TaxID=3133420 RepID=UPI0030BFD7D3
MEEVTELELQHAYLKMVRDADFDRLELALNEPNIFSILSIEHMEIRHSNFLGWLLNPKESHGLNDLFLKRFLREIFSDDKVSGISALHAETLDFQKVEILREWRSIDLLVKFPNLVICIENKVHSKDHSNQLERYRQVVEKEFPEPEFKNVFIYLTSYGESSSLEQKYYAFFSYQIIIDILDRVLEVYKALIPPQSIIYITDYIKSLKRNLMATDTTNDLAREIYRNHQKLLDFIFENKPDYMDDFSKTIEQFLREKKYIIGSTGKGIVRFLGTQLQDVVPIYSEYNGWPKKEAFMFELDFRNKKKIMFKATGAPAPSNAAYKNRLAEILKGLEGARKTTDIWQVFISDEASLDIKKLALEEPEKLSAKLSSFWERVQPLIHKVESAMLAHREELAALKQEVEQ